MLVLREEEGQHLQPPRQPPRGPTPKEPAPTGLALLRCRLAHGPHGVAGQQGAVCTGPCTCRQDVLPLGGHRLGPWMHGLVARSQLLLDGLNSQRSVFFWNLLGIFRKTTHCLQSLVLPGSLLFGIQQGWCHLTLAPQRHLIHASGRTLVSCSFSVLTLVHHHLVVRNRGFVAVGLAQRYCHAWKETDHGGSGRGWGRGGRWLGLPLGPVHGALGRPWGHSRPSLPASGHGTLTWAIQLRHLLLLLGVLPRGHVHRALNLGPLRLLLLVGQLRLASAVLGHVHNWVLTCRHGPET